jgi:tRNA A37 threonylcarbamoyladenosine dehydratase
MLDRTKLLIGEEGVARLAESKVAIFGIGGVGGYAVEALARSGVGMIALFDDDVVSPTNINRQIIATVRTIGRYKVDVAKERVADINPTAVVKGYRMFYSEKNANEVDLSHYDYIIDAIDTVSSKIQLVLQSKANCVPIISSMGAGNKMDPTKFAVDDIYNTSVCPLAKVMRRELRNRGVESLKVVYSKEVPVKPVHIGEDRLKRVVPGSNAFVPPAAGLVIASEVVKDLLADCK